MKLIEQKAEYWKQENVKKHIEKCARVCYKSECNITDDSAEKFVNRLIKSKHHAMLEHATVYLTLQGGREKREDDAINFFILNPYSTVNIEPENSNIIYVTTNHRVFRCMPIDCWDWVCKKTEHHADRHTMFLTTSIGIVRELLRHRNFSFANESTRYCNYNNSSKFGNDITFIKPYWAKLNTGKYVTDFVKHDLYNIGDGFLVEFDDYTVQENILVNELIYSEFIYKSLIEKHGRTAQEARDCLPLCTKSDIVMTGFSDDWEHFFDLRLRGTTGAPHPDMKILAEMIYEELKDK